MLCIDVCGFYWAFSWNIKRNIDLLNNVFFTTTQPIIFVHFVPRHYDCVHTNNNHFWEPLTSALVTLPPRLPSPTSTLYPHYRPHHSHYAKYHTVTMVTITPIATTGASAKATTVPRDRPTFSERSINSNHLRCTANSPSNLQLWPFHIRVIACNICTRGTRIVCILIFCGNALGQSLGRALGRTPG